MSKFGVDIDLKKVMGPQQASPSKLGAKVDVNGMIDKSEKKQEPSPVGAKNATTETGRKHSMIWA